MSFENNIKKMYSEFDEGQKKWFRVEFPEYLQEWMMGGFNGKQLSRNPALIEDYFEHNVSLSAAMPVGVLDRLLLALWCVRKCHGPIHAPTLYRLTKIPDLKEGTQTVRIQAKNSLKPITSWTTQKNVVVHDRNPSDADYIISLTDVQPKFVLASIEVLFEFANLVLKNSEYFGLDIPIEDKSAKKAKKAKIGKKAKSKYANDGFYFWKHAQGSIRSYLDEKEFLIYLHPHEELVARVYMHVENPFPKKKAATKKKPAVPAPKKKLDNPFASKIGGMDKYSPQEQYRVTKAMFDKFKAKGGNSNHQMLMDMDQRLTKMRNYAKQEGIVLE